MRGSGPGGSRVNPTQFAYVSLENARRQINGVGERGKEGETVFHGFLQRPALVFPNFLDNGHRPNAFLQRNSPASSHLQSRCRQSPISDSEATSQLRVVSRTRFSIAHCRKMQLCKCGQNLQCSSALQLASGSYYIPKQRKGFPLGDDAHFICVNQDAVGIADGVGSYRSKHKIDPGNYARELMSHVEKAVADGAIGAVDLMRVLATAHLETKAKGASTACILAIQGQSIHAVNIGDGGFMVVRSRNIVFRTPVQIHRFNFPLQLGSSHRCDPPSAAQTFEVAVEEGDVIVASTDGLFDNLFDHEVASAIINFTVMSLEPRDMAWLLADMACERSKDKTSNTPYSVASYSNFLSSSSSFEVKPHHGGKKDDITVIVAKVINGSDDSGSVQC